VASFGPIVLKEVIADGLGSDVVGEAFGVPVTQADFAYYYQTASLFSRSGKPDRTEEETRQEAWQNLVLLKEANRLGIKVERPELEVELNRLVAEKGIRYGTEMYKVWVRLTFHEEVEIFERRLEDLLKIHKLTQQKMDPDVIVTEDEIKQRFLDQYNSFESEYIHFAKSQEAQDFLKQVKENPKIWKETFEKKKGQEGQIGAAWLNVMALGALMDLWKIPREDAYQILQAKEGDFLPAKNIYGDCIFRLLFKVNASLGDLDEKKKEEYRRVLTVIKKQQAAQDYFNDLIKRAHYRDYIEERRGAQEKAKRAAQVEKLKEKAAVVLETNRGNIELKLYPEVAPKACENFIGLVEKGYYSGLILHRVKKGFMIQGGDPTGTGTGGESIWGKPFEDEFSDKVVFDRPGLLAMANSGPNTNQSQFFITTVPTPWLNGKHTIFGEVLSGMEAVRQIENSATNSDDKPLEEQKILKATIKSTPAPS